jgi:hypothetical protein
MSILGISMIYGIYIITMYYLKAVSLNYIPEHSKIAFLIKTRS